MKRTVSILLALAMVLGLTACGSKPNAAPDTPRLPPKAPVSSRRSQKLRPSRAMGKPWSFTSPCRRPMTPTT